MWFNYILFSLYKRTSIVNIGDQTYLEETQPKNSVRKLGIPELLTTKEGINLLYEYYAGKAQAAYLKAWASKERRFIWHSTIKPKLDT